MKEMIKSFHNENIAVIMDCVFNHTYEYENSSFNKTVLNYYYRQDEHGKLIANSQCKNDTASERFMFKKYMIDAVTYWAREYHMDGFRFDLMGLHDIDTMNKIRHALDKISPNILMYGEGWDLGDEITITDDEKAIKVNARKLDNRVAFFSDDMRDDIRGHVFEDRSGGFVNYNTNGDKWREMAIIINAGERDEEVNLRKSGWAVVVKEERAGTEMLELVHEDKVLVKGKTSMVLVKLQN